MSKKNNPGFVVAGGHTPAAAPADMSPEELEYRTMLQEAIFWVTKQILSERQEEITKRAADRVRTLQELRK